MNENKITGIEKRKMKKLNKIEEMSLQVMYDVYVSRYTR